MSCRISDAGTALAMRRPRHQDCPLLVVACRSDRFTAAASRWPTSRVRRRCLSIRTAPTPDHCRGRGRPRGTGPRGLLLAADRWGAAPPRPVGWPVAAFLKPSAYPPYQVERAQPLRRGGVGAIFSLDTESTLCDNKDMAMQSLTEILRSKLAGANLFQVAKATGASRGSLIRFRDGESDIRLATAEPVMRYYNIEVTVGRGSDGQGDVTP